MTRNAVYNKQMKLIEKAGRRRKDIRDPSADPDCVPYGKRDYDKVAKHFYMHGNRLMKKEYQGLLEYLNE